MKLTKEQRDKLHKWLFTVWEKREKDGYVKCFETGKRLKTEKFKYNLSCYSHILAKSEYPQYMLNEDNIAIVHPDAHFQYGVDQDRTPKQRDLKKMLIAKHIRGEL